MIEVLLLRRAHPASMLADAIGSVLRLGVSDARAVASLCRHLQEGSAPAVPGIEVGALSRYDRPLPDVSPYDALLEGMGS
jgi:hypothetical protein